MHVRVIRKPAVLLSMFLMFSMGGLACQSARSQGDSAEPVISQAELQALAADLAEQESNFAESSDATTRPGSINLKELLIKGGVLMIPVALMSLLVVTVVIERAIGLRMAKIYPRKIRKEVRAAVQDTAAGTPQSLYEVTRNSPSAASRIMEDVLQKIGRPIPEIEAAIGEGTQRESETLYANVRWLTLAAAVTPLIGLLGTVWGMIIAFYNTTTLGSGANKAEQLAEGIYVALVTTLGGLAVAIPAAIFAHYFEGKITRVLARLERDLRRLCSRFEPFEGKTRYDLSARGLTRRVLPEMKGRRNPAMDKAGESQPAAPPVQPPVRNA